MKKFIIIENDYDCELAIGIRFNWSNTFIGIALLKKDILIYPFFFMR